MANAPAVGDLRIVATASKLVYLADDNIASWKLYQSAYNEWGKAVYGNVDAFARTLKATAQQFTKGSIVPFGEEWLTRWGTNSALSTPCRVAHVAWYWMMNNGNFDTLSRIFYAEVTGLGSRGNIVQTLWLTSYEDDVIRTGDFAYIYVQQLDYFLGFWSQATPQYWNADWVQSSVLGLGPMGVLARSSYAVCGLQPKAKPNDDRCTSAARSDEFNIPNSGGYLGLPTYIAHQGPTSITKFEEVYLLSPAVVAAYQGTAMPDQTMRIIATQVGSAVGFMASIVSLNPVGVVMSILGMVFNFVQSAVAEDTRVKDAQAKARLQHVLFDDTVKRIKQEAEYREQIAAELMQSQLAVQQTQSTTMKIVGIGGAILVGLMLVLSETRDD